MSDRANVSSRTFFNYFALKQAAALGIDPGGMSEEAIEHLSHHRSDDVLHDVASLVYSVIADSTIIEEVRDLRKLVLERYPELLNRQMPRVSAMEDRLGPVVADWLRTEPNFATYTGEQLEEAAQIPLSVCLSALRVAMKNRSHDISSDPHENYTGAVDMLRAVIEGVV